METQYFLKIQSQKIPREPRLWDPDGMFVLLTTIPDGRQLPDRKVLEAYKGQQVVEMGFNWMKGPLAVAPVFLKLPTRIEVLGFVYLISMFLYALVQRDLRAKVEKSGQKIVHPGGRKTDKPTTRGLFKVFEWVERQIWTAENTTKVFMRFLDSDLIAILETMGWEHLYYGNPGGCT